MEVRDFPATRRGDPVLADARWRTTGVADTQVSRREAGLRVITRAAEIRALPRAEAERGYPVRLEATVTYASDANGHVFVQDDTAGVYVHFTRWPVAAVSGERIRLEGFTAPGGLAPMVVDPVVTHLGRVALPPPLPVAPARLAAGFDDCRRVATSGYVRRIRRGERETEMILGVEGLRVPVHLPLEIDDATLPPLDARVRIAAVCGTAFNWRSLFDHVELYAVGADVFVEEAPGNPFALPLAPVRDLLRSAPGGRWDRLVRTHGVVLYHRDGQPLYLRTPSGTVVAETSRAEPVVPGDEVDVVGFPAPGGSTVRLGDATFRRRRGRPAARARGEQRRPALRACARGRPRAPAGHADGGRPAGERHDARPSGRRRRRPGPGRRRPRPGPAGREHARGHRHPPRARPGGRRRAPPCSSSCAARPTSRSSPGRPGSRRVARCVPSCLSPPRLSSRSPGS